MSIFIVIGAIGVVLLVLSMLFDGVADAFDMLDGLDFANGYLSTTALGAAAALLGATGIVTLTAHGPMLLAWTLGAVVAVITLALVAKISQALRRSAVPELVVGDGARGRTVGALTSTGEILVDGELNKRLAKTTGPAIPDGARIRVVGREEPFLVVIADETAQDPTPTWPQATHPQES